MLLAIDASRAAGEQKTGVVWYCHHLLRHLKFVIPDDVGVVLYSDQPLPEELRPWPSHWEERVLRWRPLPLWSQLRLVGQVLRDRPDVLFVPAHVLPEALAYRKRHSVSFLRLVTTIHDIAFRAWPEAYGARERWYADHATRIAVRSADRIIVPTHAVAEDLVRHYIADRRRITVIPHGVMAMQYDASRIPLPSSRIPPVPFLLYVGRLERKKNVARMVDAFSRIAPAHPELRFILAGPPGYGYEDVCAALARAPARDRIVTPGWIDPPTYRALLGRATALCFPTLAEGFGLPILEAMASGVPVITSRGHAHEEVAGDAAILVDAGDTASIAAGMDRVLCDPALREDLVRRGQQRAAAFTWESTARGTWDVLRDVLSA